MWHLLILPAFPLGWKFPNSWIGRSSLISWPTKSHTVYPLEHVLSGVMEGSVYQSSVQNLLQFKQIMSTPIWNLTRDVFGKTWIDIENLMHADIWESGDHIEHQYRSIRTSFSELQFDAKVSCQKHLDIRYIKYPNVTSTLYAPCQGSQLGCCGWTFTRSHLVLAE